MAVQLTDNRIQVDAAITQALSNALVEAGLEVAAMANRNVQLEDDAGQKLRGSYSVQATRNGNAVGVRVGTPLEEGFWEEFGTGSYADMSKNGGIPGRPMWWVYVTNETPRTDHPIYRTEEEAKAIAASWQEEGKDAHASNGRKPSYTLEKSFIASKPSIIAEFERQLRNGVR